MKHNAKSIISMIMEYLILIAPTAGYSIYCYQDTLQYTMSNESKGAFWSLISLAILVSVVFAIFKKQYNRYVDGYVYQKNKLEVEPENKLLVKKVAEKKVVIDNIDYLVAVIPLAILLTIISAFSQSIDQLTLIVEIVIASILGKVGLHNITVHLQKIGLKGNNNE